MKPGSTASDYVPWPEIGCTLAQARELVADRKAWKQLCEQSVPLKPDLPPNVFDAKQKDASVAARNNAAPTFAVGDILNGIDAAFREHLTSGQLIAYGRPRHHNASPELISRKTWPALT